MSKQKKRIKAKYQGHFIRRDKFRARLVELERRVLDLEIANVYLARDLNQLINLVNLTYCTEESN